MDSNQLSTKQGGGSGSPGTRAQRNRPQRNWKLGQSAAQVTLLCLLGAGCFLSLFPTGRALTRSVFVLPALISASEPAPLIFAGAPVSIEHLTIASINGPIYLDIYGPATPPPPIPGGREAMIDVVGVGDNRNIPQLVNLSESFAREGIVVVNVGTPTLFQYKLSARDGEAVVQAFKLLEHWPGVNPNHIGILAYSAGVTLAVAGAANPSISEHVAFLAILGGFFDATTLLESIGTHTQVVNGHIQSWQPQSTPLYVLVRTVSSLLSPTDDQLLGKAFPLSKIGPPLTAQQQAQLSPDGAALYHLLEGDEPKDVSRNLTALSPQMKALLTQLSPQLYINQIHAPIHLLHDRNDTIISFSQSQQFAAALARIHHPYDFAAYSIFSHVEVQSNLKVGQVLTDGSKLFRVLISILQVGS
jgi:hypothetical protein